MLLVLIFLLGELEVKMEMVKNRKSSIGPLLIKLSSSANSARDSPPENPVYIIHRMCHKFHG